MLFSALGEDSIYFLVHWEKIKSKEQDLDFRILRNSE